MNKIYNIFPNYSEKLVIEWCTIENAIILSLASALEQDSCSQKSTFRLIADAKVYIINEMAKFLNIFIRPPHTRLLFASNPSVRILSTSSSKEMPM